MTVDSRNIGNALYNFVQGIALFVGRSVFCIGEFVVCSALLNCNAVVADPASKAVYLVDTPTPVSLQISSERLWLSNPRNNGCAQCPGSAHGFSPVPFLPGLPVQINSRLDRITGAIYTAEQGSAEGNKKPP